MLDVTILQMLLSIISGFVVGFSLGLIGGGGSILAVPLLLYFVGLSSFPDATHLALGTTALAVGLNAYINSYMHVRRGNVAPRIGVAFTVPGLLGSFAGAYLGELTPGEKLLLYFSLAMITLGIYVALSRRANASEKCPEKESLVEGQKPPFSFRTSTGMAVMLAGFTTGLASGYFGIGGGFLIVPALILSSKMCIKKAVGTSLIAVGTFGLATGLVYAFHGKVLYMVSLLYVLGGLMGGYLGTLFVVRVPGDKLRRVYGIIIVLVGIYILLKAIGIT